MQNPIGPIHCAVCNKQADRVTAWYDAADMAVKLKVECHGAEDRMEISEREFLKKEDHDAFMAALRRGGTAFQNKSLPDQPKRLTDE